MYPFYTVGAIIFETLSLVTYTSERVSKIMAPTVKQFLSAGRDMGFGFGIFIIGSFCKRRSVLPKFI